MTICIAAICENKYVVVATDRMLTLPMPNIEYEADYSKMVELSKNCVVVTAGSAIALTPIVNVVRGQLAQQGSPDIAATAELIRAAYEQVRSSKVNEEILSTYGLNLQTFYQANLGIHQQLMAMIIQRIQQYNYNLWVIVAGVDGTGGHIYRVENPAQKNCFDSIGYHAIGSGEIHAITTFIANEYKVQNTSLTRGLALIYEAKRRSEKAQGVGPQTDIAIVTVDKTVHLPVEAIAKLDEVYQKKVEQEKKAVSEVEKMIESLDFANYLK